MIKKLFEKKQKQKVLLGMSGGVDSSVAALLLKKQGYDVYGAFMKNYSGTKNKITGECAWVEERNHAIKIATLLDIPFVTLDFENEYKSLVVDPMFKKYRQGVTPNPDIDCNQKIKFPMFIKEAKKIGINFIATGHYARIKKKGNKFEMHRAKDEKKDQSYFLYRQNQSDLSHTIFPIGKISKVKVRKIAEKNKFQNANKKGTVGICFIGKVNMKEFLQKKIKPKKGKILNPDGKIIGEHDGIYYYTIGQRLGSRYGFEIKRDTSSGRLLRWYVARKDVKKNIIIAAPQGHELNYRQEIIIQNFHLIDEDKKVFKSNCRKKKRKVLVRIRQAGELLHSYVTYEKNKVKIILKEKINGVSEGQAIVIYDKTKVIGGGEISF